QGVLQDVHWAHGSFGYFPTYSLGSFYAAQFYAQAKKDIADMEPLHEQGEFGKLLQWLRAKVHVHGRRYRSAELCKLVTGEGLDFNAFMQYAQEKYTDVYDINMPHEGGGKNT
ncbi:MAG: carboxypeptidase M32, partial [Taibaiella sp.]|nr:carboxypeptidase M32 [Taibaiella sp.]